MCSKSQFSFVFLFTNFTGKLLFHIILVLIIHMSPHIACYISYIVTFFTCQMSFPMYHLFMSMYWATCGWRILTKVTFQLYLSVDTPFVVLNIQNLHLGPGSPIHILCLGPIPDLAQPTLRSPRSASPFPFSFAVWEPLSVCRPSIDCIFRAFVWASCCCCCLLSYLATLPKEGRTYLLLHPGAEIQFCSNIKTA